MLNVVLYAPEIPANTGNIGRTCVVTGARLHLVRPLGFSLDSKMLRRAGLGYWENLDVREYDSWEAFLKENGLDGAEGARRIHLLTKKARRTYAEASYADGDFLVFGSESSGIPEEVLASMAGRCERIPMLPDGASLDNREAWAAREDALHGVGGCSGGHRGAAEGADGRAGRCRDVAGETNAAVATASNPVEAAANGDAPSPLLRQDICGNFIAGDGYRISALNLSNAVAVVLYEALRQTEFQGM